MGRRVDLGLDPDCPDWLDGPQSPAGERDVAIAQNGLVLHVTRHEARRRNGWLRLASTELDDLAGKRPLMRSGRAPRSSTASAARAGSAAGHASS